MKRQIVCVAGIACLLLIGGCAGSSDGFGKSLYVGGGAGISRLTPVTDNTPYRLESSSDIGFFGLFGMDISKRFAGELQIAQLGAATIENTSVTGQSDVDIDYGAIGLSGLYYGLGRDEVLASRQRGFAAFLRLGIADMSHSSSIALDIDDSLQLWAGLGAEYMFDGGLAARLEFSNYDGDAQALQLSAIYRFAFPGQRSRSSSKPATGGQSTVPQRVPDASSKPDVASRPVTPTRPQQQPQPMPETTVQPPRQTSRSVLAGVQDGLDFRVGTSQLTSTGVDAMRRLVQQLNENPAVRVELQTHTDNSAGDASAVQLTRQRVIVIAKALISSGISKSRLSARAFGAAAPRASNATLEGRILNNRVEVRITAR